MSNSLIAFQPAIDEPSNITPSANASSSTIDTSKVTCCHLPRGSVNRKSTYLMSLSLIAFSTSLAVCMIVWSSSALVEIFPAWKAVACGCELRSRRIPSRRFGCGWPPRLSTRKFCRRRCARSALPCGWRRWRLDQIVGEDDLEFHLRQEVDHVLGAAIEFGVAFLPPEPLGLDHRDALQPHLLERFFHLIELERLDDGFDFLHPGAALSSRICRF